MKETGFINALGTLIYIVAVAALMQNGSKIFGQEDNFFSPIIFLLLFTLSALVVGSLILGQPLMQYLDGKKKEAVALFMQTVSWLAVFTILILAVAALAR